MLDTHRTGAGLNGNQRKKIKRVCPWTSAHRGKWGQLTPTGKMDEKLKKREHAKRAVFYVYVIF